MRRKISGFHQDQHSDWVAELECGHGQHVRHQPPWQIRPWVTTAQGRHSRIGIELECRKCDEGAPPDAWSSGGI
ncbi:MAG: DUF3565 domain-containing protein [Candidatus Binataceae bacterium]|nr:DUF3565 domain-containing protein [Candidatus Binataceae bacterium]